MDLDEEQRPMRMEEDGGGWRRRRMEEDGGGWRRRTEEDGGGWRRIEGGLKETGASCCGCWCLGWLPCGCLCLGADGG
jgi:hypothetical protein